MNTFAFTTVDFIVIGIVSLSAILGLIRGIVREAISLVGFALAMYIAYNYSSIFAAKSLIDTFSQQGNYNNSILKIFELYIKFFMQ